MLSQVVYGRTYFGFTTFGHTIENVFLAMYHPGDDVLSGCPTNIDVHSYLCRQMGLTGKLSGLTEELFAPHQEVFKGFETTTDSLGVDNYRLTVRYKKNTLEADSYSNYVTVNKKRINLESVIVYMDKKKTFYLPKKLREYIEVGK